MTGKHIFVARTEGNVKSLINGNLRLQTDHSKNDLRVRSVRGGAVTLLAQCAALVLRTASTMALGRLLSPDDFGLVAMVTAFTGFIELFKDCGLSMATVQREQITHEQVSTLFWLNVALSLTLAAITALCAPVIAWFYDEPRLTLITLAIAATFIFGGLSAQHQALLQRQMRFSAMAAVQLSGMSGGILIGIALAYWTGSYWALVAMSATSGFISAVTAWSVCGWVPGKAKRGAGVKSMLVFGANLTGFNAVNYFARNADNILIGWWWGGGSLGMYSRAYNLFMLPLREVNGPIARVALPALSQTLGDEAAYRRRYLRFLSVVSSVTMPIVVFSALFPSLIISFLLGEQWMPAVEIFRALALAALVQPLLNTTGWIFISQARTAEMRNWGIFSSVTMVVSFLVGLPFGPTAVAYSYTVCVYMLAWPCLRYALNGTPISPWSCVKTHLIPVGMSLASGLIAFAVALSWGRLMNGGLLIPTFVVYASIYSGLVYRSGLFEGLVSCFPALERIMRPKA